MSENTEPEWTAYEPCPSCGGNKFREQRLEYEDVTADPETGETHDISYQEAAETVAIFCDNYDCPHYEEPLVCNWILVSPTLDENLMHTVDLRFTPEGVSLSAYNRHGQVVGEAWFTDDEIEDLDKSSGQSHATFQAS